jgi:hypothetical protein
MITTMHSTLSDNYSSNSQKIRVLTENWVCEYMYCPNCLTSTVDLKHKVTLLSSIGIDVDDIVFVCECCSKKVDPITLDKMRDEKIKRINI